MPIAWFKDKKGNPVDAYIIATNGISPLDKSIMETAYSYDRNHELRLRRRFFICGSVLAVLALTLFGWAIQAPRPTGDLGTFAVLFGAVFVPASALSFSYARSIKPFIKNMDVFIRDRIGQDILIFDKHRSRWWMVFVAILKTDGSWYAMSADMQTSSVTGEWLSGEIANHLASLPDVNDTDAAEQFAGELKATYKVHT